MSTYIDEVSRVPAPAVYDLGLQSDVRTVTALGMGAAALVAVMGLSLCPTTIQMLQEDGPDLASRL